VFITAIIKTNRCCGFWLLTSSNCVLVDGVVGAEILRENFITGSNGWDWR
jgi:hypothetical protein